MSEVLEKLIADWQGPIYGLALRRLGNEADAADTTQDIFVQILRHRDSVQDPSRLRAWIYRVAHNAITQRQRRGELRRRKTREKAEDLPIPSTEDMAITEERARVRAGLERLDDELRVALILRYYQGLSQREIGEVLGLPRTTIQSRLARGLRTLKSRLVGAPMALPTIEAALSPELIAVPPRLSESLSASAKLASSTPALIATGALMKTKLLGAGLALTLTGLLVGAGLSRSLVGPASEDARAMEQLAAENARLRLERSQLQEAQERSATKLKALARSMEAAPVLAESRRRIQSSELEVQRLKRKLAALEADQQASPEPGKNNEAGPKAKAKVAPVLAERIRGMADMIGAIQDRFKGLEEDELNAEQRSALEKERRRVSEAAGPLLQELPVLAEKTLALIEDADPEERARLLGVLSAFAEVLPPDQKAIANQGGLALLEGEQPLPVKLAAASLLRLEPGSEDERRAVRALDALLDEETELDDRRGLVQMLGQLASPEAQESLFELALDARESERIRSRALSHLEAERLQQRAGFRSLLRDPRSAVRLAAVDCLGAALDRAPSRELLAPLEEAVGAADDQVRSKVLGLLESRGDRVSLLRLQEVAADPLLGDAVQREARVAAERLEARLDKAEQGS